MENHGDKSAIIADFIQQLRDSSPGFRIWIADAFQKQNRLELVIEALIQLGEVKNEKEALEYLAKKIQNLSLKESFLTSSDFWDANRQRVRTWKLKQALQEGRAEQNGEGDIFTQDIARTCGTISHIAISELLSGRLLGTPESSEQLCFWEKENITSWPDIFSEELPITESDLFREIRKSWRSLLPLVNNDFETLAYFKTEKLSRFYALIEQIFQEYTERIKRGKGKENAFFYFLAMMSWATAVIYYGKTGKQTLFHEIPVIAKRFGLSGGRADALRIEDRYLTPKQKEQLELISREKYELRKGLKKNHPKSDHEDNDIGNFFHGLKHRLGKGRLRATIIEMKFAVGDGSSKIVVGPDGIKKRHYSLITPEQIKDGPLKQHLWQVKRYNVLASLGYHCILNEEGVKTHWPEDVYFPEAQIIYFLPSSSPIVHRITVTPEDQYAFFTEEVAQKWSSAKRRMIVRSLDNIIIGDIIKDLNNKTSAHRRIIANNARPCQTSFLPTAKNVNVIEQMVDKERRFLDSYDIIEIAGKRKGEDRTIYKMHFDRLIEALRQKNVVSAGFQPNKPGFVYCFLPGHKDMSASFHINPEQGIFKCFGSCGIGGTILPTSMPDDLSLPIPLTRWSEKTYNQTITYNPPTERHAAIMMLAQQLLQESFRASPGEEYLTQKRCLDTDLALEKGVGFGTDLLINGLLDDGFTIDELIFYGFVGFSNRFDRFADISGILKKREILPLENQNKEGYYFSVLYDRITFPLSLFEKINNFYGRIIRGNNRHFFHRKLTVKHTGVDHGGFNMSVVENPDVREVYPVEGCCDALVLMQMGYDSAIGMIGVDNRIIIETLAISDKKIAVALDYDEAGKKKTYGWHIERKDGTRQWEPGLLERLEQKGKTKKDLRDLTEEYVKSHPEIQEIINRSLSETPEKPKLDWNDWWIALKKEANK